MRGVYYIPTTLMSDIMKGNFRRHDCLTLLGVAPGFDDCATVKETCDTMGVNCDFFLHVCNQYTFEDYDLEKNIEGPYPLETAMDYINRAHDFFLRTHTVDIRENFNKITPVLPGAAKVFAVELLDELFKLIEEHIDDIKHLFDQYRRTPGSVIPGQVERIIGQEPKITATLEALIRYLAALPVPDEYKGDAEHQVGYLFHFLRKDFDVHEIIKNATLRRLIV